MHRVSFVRFGLLNSLPQFDCFSLCKEEKAFHSRLSQGSNLVILGSPSHLFRIPQVCRVSCSRTGLHRGGQSLHQQQRGTDDHPAPGPRGHGPRLLTRRQLFHRQQPHGSREAQPVRSGCLTEPKATQRESEEPAGFV